jgi:hypothetical protein
LSLELSESEASLFSGRRMKKKKTRKRRGVPMDGDIALDYGMRAR